MIRTGSTAGPDLPARAARATVRGGRCHPIVRIGGPAVVGIAILGVGVSLLSAAPTVAGLLVACGVLGVVAAPVETIARYQRALRHWKHFAPENAALMAEFGPEHIMFVAGGVTTTVDTDVITGVRRRGDMLAIGTGQSVSILIPAEMVPPMIADDLLRRFTFRA